MIYKQMLKNEFSRDDCFADIIEGKTILQLASICSGKSFSSSNNPKRWENKII